MDAEARHHERQRLAGLLAGMGAAERQRIALDIAEDLQWAIDLHYGAEPRPRQAIEAARRHMRGEAGEAEVRAALEAAREAAWEICQRRDWGSHILAAELAADAAVIAADPGAWDQAPEDAARDLIVAACAAWARAWLMRAPSVSGHETGALRLVAAAIEGESEAASA